MIERALWSGLAGAVFGCVAVLVTASVAWLRTREAWVLRTIESGRCWALGGGCCD